MKHLSALLERTKLYFELLIMIGLAYLFSHYLDGDIGVVVWSFLIIAPLLSILLSYRACHRITAELHAPAYLAKGKQFQTNVTVKAEGRLPVPFLRCETEVSANFIQEDKRPVQSAMTAEEPLEIPESLIAQYAGCGEVKIKELAVYDYLGWFKFSVKEIPEALKIGVIPEIPSLTGANLILHAVSDVVLTQDDEEEESAAAISAQSMPGYIHRDYMPGDNLRRINWKMSAKRQKLMVRMDEAASTVRPTVILDLQPEHQPESLKRREIMIESALGFLILLVRQGIPCTLRFTSAQQWKCLILENEEAVRNAAVEIAGADFINDGNRIDPDAVHEKAGAYLIYTPRPEEELLSQITPLKEKGYVCAVCPDETDCSVLGNLDAIWQVSEEYAMKALQK